MASIDHNESQLSSSSTNSSKRQTIYTRLPALILAVGEITVQTVENTLEDTETQQQLLLNTSNFCDRPSVGHI